MANLYDMSVPVYIKNLEALSTVLKKGEQWADENKVPHERLIGSSLHLTMSSLAHHVQLSSNTAKGLIPRFTGKEVPQMEDNETTFAQLQERITKTIDVLKEAKREDFDGKENVEIVMGGNGRPEFKFTGLPYLQGFGLPYFLFHTTVVYSILRSAGVPVGMLDYLGMTSA